MIIGAAFGRIVTSLVNDVIMPVIGFILGGINFRELKFVITAAVGDAPEVAILYVSFIQSVVDFVIIALSVFLFVKLLISFKIKEKAAPVAPAQPAPEVVLLEEIRDLLKAK